MRDARNEYKSGSGGVSARRICSARPPLFGKPAPPAGCNPVQGSRRSLCYGAPAMSGSPAGPIDQADAVEPGALGGGDSVHFWRAPEWRGMECLSARFVRHAYAPHLHDTYAIGVIEQGAEHFRYRGAERVAPAGSLVVVEPYEPHDGRPGDSGYRYRMMYPSIELMAELAGELAGRDAPADAPAPYFPESVLRDGAAAAAMRRAHAALEAASDRLAQDDIFLRAMSALVARHSAERPTPLAAGREDRAIARVRAYIEETLDADVSLAELAEVAGLGRYRLIRSFRRSLGVTPHVYRSSRRVIRAKERLAAGETPAGTALACGFCDQAHFTRVFKRATGVTPARYRAASRG